MLFTLRMKWPRGTSWLALAGALTCSTAPHVEIEAQTIKPHEYLTSASAPNFYERHTLPRLTRWGWNLPYDTAVELADNWGYALELGGYVTPSMVDDIRNKPTSRNARLVALAQSDPERYPLSAIAYRPLANNAPGLPTALREQYYVRDSLGNVIVDPATGGPSFRTVSPEAPDAIYEWAARGQADPLAALREITPVSMILSGGEYGVSVAGHSQAFWQQDPTVVAAKGNDSWYDYTSQRKGHFEKFVSDATRAAAPDRDLYIYYLSDGALTRNAFKDWADWEYDYSHVRPISDITNSALYFKKANTGWTGSRDMLTEVLNATAQHLTYGDKLSYNWVSAGFEGGELSDMRHYTGFLKAYYTAGMIGGIAAYHSLPTGGFNADISGAPPSWLEQLEALSQVHAGFSYLEKYLREGQLLPGTKKHAWSKDLPAYELTTNDANVRVLARKLDGKEEWLVTAWAASGKDRKVKVDVPGAGKTTVLARDTGSMYIITKQGKKLKSRMLDPDGMAPSTAMNMITATTDSGGQLDFAGENLVLDGEKFTVKLSLENKYRLDDLLVDGLSMGPLSKFTFSKVMDSHTLHFAVSPIGAQNSSLRGAMMVPEPGSMFLVLCGLSWAAMVRGGVRR
jgi:hypothetical protein